MSTLALRQSLDSVEKSRRKARRIVDWLNQGTGDSIAMTLERAARRFGVPVRSFFLLRYRRPKEIGSRVYVAIEQAYRDEFKRQEAKLEIDLDITRHLPPTPGRLAQIRETEARLKQIRREFAELG